MKKLGILLCSLLMLLMWITPNEGQAASSAMTLIVNGNVITTDVPPQMINEHTMVPISFAGRAYGVSVNWDANTKSVLIDDGSGKKILMWPGKGQGYLNGKIFTLDPAPVALNGRVFLPLRQVGEMLGATVGWENDTKSVIVNQKKNMTVNGNTLTDTPIYQLPSGNFVSVNRVVTPLGYTVKESTGTLILTRGTENYTISRATGSAEDNGYRKIGDEDVLSPEFLSQTIHANYHWNDDKTQCTLEKEVPVAPIPPAPAPVPVKDGKYLIVLDPGHGGKDSGAIGTLNNQEKNLTLAVATKLEAILQKNSNFKVVMTRSGDTYPTLQDRVNLANKLNANLFMSIHANSATPTAHGTETYYNTAQSKEFASIIHNHLVQATRFYNRGLRTANYYVIKNTKMPSTLVELGFLTNTNENKQMLDPAFQQRVAEGLAAGITEYYNKTH